ncbi:ras-related protein Rab-14-like [Histomonas meleagridis]|uniref:ras-related protein Rab-14-like n=1 Tax=Histomonas meleagridis TaxID=135588 RepID=UPI003559E8E9|nr:ras-related protein Rab-14-like [Histomonas meleagridis]KAH0799552.1 ras-related protein Rab-14-like [Histomonas meleagridis]
MSGEETESLCFKFVLVGDSAVGKTSMCKMFCEKSFDDNQPQTIGLDFGVRNIDIESTKIKLQIWDTAGQEKFRSITRAYFRGSTAVFLVFDVTNRESFSHLGFWTDDAMLLSPSNSIKVLVGNKTDLVSQRAVSTAEASDFAQQNGLTYFETSALSGERIDDTFIETAHAVYKKYLDGKVNIETRYADKENKDSFIDITEQNDNGGTGFCSC